MKRILCCLLLLALTFCAAAEGALAASVPVEEDSAATIKADAGDAPVTCEPVEESIPSEEIDLALTGEDLEPEAGNGGDAAEALPVPDADYTVSSWDELLARFKDAQDDDVIRLGASIEQQETLSLSGGKEIVLYTTSGYTLYAPDKSSDSIIIDSGKLTLNGNGDIANGNIGVTVHEDGALHAHQIGITGFTKGVLNEGELTMWSGSSITQCEIGVDNRDRGNFTLWGGNITGCETGVVSYSSFTAYKGSITGNKQGVVSYSPDTALTVGSAIVNITGNSECDVLLKKGQVVEVGRPVQAATKIGITLDPGNLPGPGAPVVVTRGLKYKGSVHNFIVWGDGDQYEKSINADGELEVSLKASDTPTAWTVNTKAGSYLTSGEKTVFRKAVKGLGGISLKPVFRLAKQTAVGTNYAFLCTSTTATASSTDAWKVVLVNKDPKGRCTVLKAKSFDIENLKTRKSAYAQPTGDGAWTYNGKAVSPKGIPSAANRALKKAAKGYTDASLTPLALLGTQVVSGANYKLLCRGASATEKGKVCLYEVNVYKNTEGVCEITDCNVINLPAYLK